MNKKWNNIICKGLVASIVLSSSVGVVGFGNTFNQPVLAQSQKSDNTKVERINVPITFKESEKLSHIGQENAKKIIVSDSLTVLAYYKTINEPLTLQFGESIMAPSLKNTVSAGIVVNGFNEYFFQFKLVPKAPIINKFYINSKSVEGIAEKGAKKVILTIDGNKVGSGTVDKQGLYKINIEDIPDMRVAGTKFQVYSQDFLKSDSELAISEVTGKQPEKGLTINPYTIGGSYITGTYGQQEATKVVLYVDGKAVKNSALDTASHTYKVAANGFIKNNNQKVEMVMSKGTKELGRVTVKTIVKDTFTVNPYSLGQSYITGTYDQEATKVVLYVDGKAVKNSALDVATHTYKLAANGFIKNSKQKVEVVMSKGTKELKRIDIAI